MYQYFSTLELPTNSTESESESFLDENSDFGTTNLKNYRISGTPQRAYSLGFEYQDPKYWWFQANANFLSNTYLDISPLLRTENFYLDNDGVPFVDDETGVQVTQKQVLDLLHLLRELILDHI